MIADAKLSLSMMTALAALLGLVHGYLNGTGMGQSGFAMVAVLGLTAGVFVLIVLAAAFVVQLRVLGTNRRARGRKLDRCQRSSDARLVVSWKLAPHFRGK